MATTFETAILALSPMLNYDGSLDGSSNLTSDGSEAFSLTPTSSPGSAGTGPTGTGDVTWNPGGIGYFSTSAANAALNATTTGTIIFSWKTGVSLTAENQWLWAQGRDNSGAQIMGFYLNAAGGIRFVIAVNGFSSNSLIMTPDVAGEYDDDTWHFAAIRQKADTTGIELYVDGSWLAVTNAALGTSSVDDWHDYFESVVLVNRFRFGRASNGTATGLQEGESSHISFYSSALTDVQVGNLYNAWLSSIPFDVKTVRRNGRRLFSENI